MLTKKLRPAILALLVLSCNGIGHAADMSVECKLKGGTVVQLSAEACKIEGGAQVDATSSTAAPEAATTSDPTLTEAQNKIIEILSKPVEHLTPLNRNPEGIGRKARFDGCKLVVDGELHIEYGNAYSVWKDFKIHSVVDFQKIKRSSFGIFGTVTSKGGKLTGEAVYVEERTNKAGNNISISVQSLRDDKYEAYTVHGPSAYFETPGEYMWIEDVYGYVKDTGWDTADTSMIRLLYIVKSSDDAKNLKSAFEEVNMTCKMQEKILSN
jgi:hypothetical protein